MHKPDAGASRPRRRAALAYHPGPLIADEMVLRDAAELLRAKDPEIVETLIAIGGHPPLRRREPGFAGLAAIIVSQQVSVASASAIFGRLESRIAPLEASRLAEATEDDLRGCGLSTPKIRALRALAHAVAEGGLDLAGPRRADRRRGAQGAGRGQGRRPLDGRHLPAVLPRTSRRLPRRGSRLAGGGQAGARSQAATRRGAPGADRRALAALARRRRPDALGLLPGRQTAFGDGSRQWFGLRQTRVWPGDCFR